MQKDRTFKMSELADTEIKDVPTLNILICYLMKKIDKPINTEHLYDILIPTGLVNYFYYQDSIGFLLENGHIKIEKKELGEGFKGGNISDLGGYYNELVYFTNCAKENKKIENATLSDGAASLRFVLEEINNA